MITCRRFLESAAIGIPLIFHGCAKPNAEITVDTPNDELRTSTVDAIRRATSELRTQVGDSRLFGFALCTDDDVRTLYHVACTTDWVKEKEKSYADIGFVYVEWTLSASYAPFDAISQRLAALADQTHASDDYWAAARDRRFDALVLALSDCRNAGIFDPETLLCVGSTDPSDHLEALAMKAVDAVNLSAIADKFAKALGYEKYRRRS